MNVVLYTPDFEPITVIDLPMWGIDRISTGERFRVAIPSPVSCHAISQSTPMMERILQISIYAERLIWRNKEKKLIFITDDDETALLLKASWLPGQQGEINSMHHTISLLSHALMRSLGPE
jgi:hypothetical protein